MLYAIGAGSQVKAVDEFSDYPKTAPRTALDGFQPNVEAIVAYRPDLVVVPGDSTGLTARLKAFGIPVLSLPPAATLADAYGEYDKLGQATGHVQAAWTEAGPREVADRADREGRPSPAWARRTTTSSTRPTTR